MLLQGEVVSYVRRRSIAFSRGKSRYRGVSGREGRWETRIGTFAGLKNVRLIFQYFCKGDPALTPSMMGNIADTHSPEYASDATLYGAWPADLYNRSLLWAQEQKVYADHNRAGHFNIRGVLLPHSTAHHACIAVPTETSFLQLP